MRNINEVLYELEEITNKNLDAVHSLTKFASTHAKDNAEQLALAKTIATIWDYLKPVHRMIREQNPAEIKLYDKIDEYIALQNKHEAEAKPLEINKLECPVVDTKKKKEDRYGLTRPQKAKK
jgi:uncharacterized membrane-anchored protein